jgi:hypothetical protein
MEYGRDSYVLELDEASRLLYVQIRRINVSKYN